MGDEPPMGVARLQRTCLVVMAIVAATACRLLSDDAPAWLAGVLAACQAAAIAALLGSGLAGLRRALLAGGVFAAVLTGILAVAMPARSIVMITEGLCHAGVYLGLLIWFGRSLGAGQEPVVTAIARRVRRSMPDAVVRYTRRVTIAWCIFFLAQLVVSAALLAWSSELVWSAFVGWMNLPLVATMVLAENGVRLMLFRSETRTTLLGTIAAMRHTADASGHRL